MSNSLQEDSPPTVRRVPGLVGVEHFSTSVPDVDSAAGFFVDVLGATVTSRSEFSGSDGGFDMVTSFNAHRDASAKLVTLDLHGVWFELFEYDAPDLNTTPPRNCDAGGHHLGFRVDDVEAAAEVLATVPGVKVLGRPNFDELPDGRRRGWVYFLTPWGLQMEVAEERPAAGPAEGSPR